MIRPLREEETGGVDTVTEGEKGGRRTRGAEEASRRRGGTRRRVLGRNPAAVAWGMTRGWRRSKWAEALP
jgi:hypothetical protein